MRLTAISVKTALDDRGISQTRLARELGVTREIVSRWCRQPHIFYIDVDTGVLMRVQTTPVVKPVNIRAVNDDRAFMSLLDGM